MKKINIPTAFENSSFLNECNFSQDDIFIKKYKKGSFINDEYEGKPCVGYIYKGAVSVLFIEKDSSKTPLNTLFENECFGISNLFSSESLNTSLVCKNQVIILYIPKTIVLQKMQEFPIAALKYAEFCNNKINFLLSRISVLAMPSAKKRLVKFLLLNLDSENNVPLTLTRENLALHIGVSRAALYREISDLTKANIIELNKNYIKIKDLKKLCAFLDI